MGLGSVGKNNSEPVLNKEEQEVMDDILKVMAGIRQKLGMKANTTEIVGAIHVLQGFVIQHMLHRIAPERWSGWDG
jgi:hypothetical protein